MWIPRPFSLCGITLSAVLAVRLGCSQSIRSNGDILFNFTDPSTGLERWVESSDTVREVGMSKASFVIQQTQRYRRAIFFALLNPQPNGACFAGFRTESVEFDPSKYQAVQIRIQNTRGELTRYKVTMNHGGDSQRNYEIFFNPRETQGCGSDSDGRCEIDVTLPLADFQAMYRGKLDPNAPALSSAPVKKFGIQAAGGVYETEKQSGVGALEIDWIKLLP